MLCMSTPEVKNLITEIEANRGNDDVKMLDLAMNLYDLAQTEGNNDLKAYASCALGDACCQNFDFTNAVLYLTEGIQGLINCNEDLMCARCLNELGIVLRSQGHYMASEDAFLNSIRLSRLNKFTRYEAMAASNFGSLCIEMSDFEDALKYYERAIECFYSMSENENRYRYIVSVLSYMVRIYIKMNNEFKATTTFRDMENNIISHKVMDDSFEVADIRMLYYEFIGNREYAEKYKAEAINKYYSYDNYTVYFDECTILFDYLFESQEYDELLKALEHFKSLAIYDDFVNQFISIEMLYMKIYEIFDDKENLLKSTQNYVKLLSRKNDEAKKSFADTVKLRTSNAEDTVKKMFDAARESKDSLTGIAGRDNGTLVLQKIFETAYAQRQELAVEALDIDQFAELNSEIGTDSGDKVLVEIAGVLSSLEDDKIMVFRYDSDFFLIYYYDCTDLFITDMMKTIAGKMPEIARKLGLDQLTVSQGAINHIPKEGNKPWDFLSCADDALYKVKKMGGNNAILINCRKEIENASLLF